VHQHSEGPQFFNGIIQFASWIGDKWQKIDKWETGMEDWMDKHNLRNAFGLFSGNGATVTSSDAVTIAQDRLNSLVLAAGFSRFWFEALPVCWLLGRCASSETRLDARRLLRECKGKIGSAETAVEVMIQSHEGSIQVRP
jgi:hypothetical protein